MSNSNDFKKGLNVIELEDRLETVQVGLEATIAADCDRCDVEL